MPYLDRHVYNPPQNSPARAYGFPALSHLLVYGRWSSPMVPARDGMLWFADGLAVCGAPTREGESPREFRGDRLRRWGRGPSFTLRVSIMSSPVVPKNRCQIGQAPACVTGTSGHDGVRKQQGWRWGSGWGGVAPGFSSGATWSTRTFGPIPCGACCGPVGPRGRVALGWGASYTGWRRFPFHPLRISGVRA